MSGLAEQHFILGAQRTMHILSVGPPKLKLILQDLLLAPRIHQVPRTLHGSKLGLLGRRVLYSNNNKEERLEQDIDNSRIKDEEDQENGQEDVGGGWFEVTTAEASCSGGALRASLALSQLRLNLNLFTVRIRVSVIRVHRGVTHHRPFMAFKIFFLMPSVGAFTSGFKSSILPLGGMFKSTINLLIFVPATPLDCVSRPTSKSLDPSMSTNTTNNSNRMIVGK
ncbi:hypothetical protein PIB30_078348 [Stylosanthes scabra]|uniref:Uncharacterized protein n=1 Tax=Stylosanthes scabra TaxID=79078 RepID=A0ABU6ZPN3_9FABA|nr:hypothetical protein [Stylosanthes scabra]